MQSSLYEDANGIRRFKDIKIQQQIDDAVSRLANSKDKKFIVIGHTDSTGEWKVSSAFKVNDKFSIQAAVYDNWKKPQGLTFESEVVLSF